MAKKEESKDYSEPREGQPLLYKRRQVTHGQPQAAPQVTWTTIVPIPEDRLTLWPRPIRSQSPTRSRSRRHKQEGGHSVPRSNVTGPQRLSVSNLLPLHGPQLTLAPPRQLSAQRSRAPCDSVKLPPLPAAAASGCSPRGTARAVGAASDSVKLPPLPAASASGSSPRGTACVVGSKAMGQRKPGPPSLWGTMAAGRAHGTPSLESRTLEGLWHGSAARQGHRRPPVQPTCGLPVRTGSQLAWKHLGHSKTEELVEVQEGHGGNTYRDHFGGLSTYPSQDRSIISTSAYEQSSVHQGVGAESQELPSASTSTKGGTAEGGKCPVLLSPAELAEQSCISENLQARDTALKELEEQQENKELPETEAAGEWDSDLQSALLAPLKENEVEAEASALVGDAWDEGHSKLFLTSEPEKTSGFSASPFSGGPCEEGATRGPAEHAALQKQLCMGPDALIHLMQEERGKLEKLEEEKTDAELFGEISSCMGNEEIPMTPSCVLRDPASPTLEPVADPSVPHSAGSATKGATEQTLNYSEFVSPVLSAVLESDSDDLPCLETLLNELQKKREQEEAAGERDSEAERPSSLPPQEEAFEPAPTAAGSDLSDEGHSEPLPAALPEEQEKFEVCASPAQADAAWMEAGRVQPTPPQEKPCGDEPPAGACPEPAQPLARSVPACPAGSAAVPQPPAPRPRRSVVKRARRALRRLFSFSCLRGQPEE